MSFNSATLVENLLFRYIHYPLLWTQALCSLESSQFGPGSGQAPVTLITANKRGFGL